MTDENRPYDPERRHRYYESQKSRKADLENSLLGVAGLTLERLLDLLKEFLRTANSNPAVGVASALIVTDVLYRTHIIDLQTALAVDVMVGALDGGQIAGTIVEDITSVTHFFSKSPSNLDLKPSANTVVYAENSSDSGLIKALLTREGVKG